MQIGSTRRSSHAQRHIRDYYSPPKGKASQTKALVQVTRNSHRSDYANNLERLVKQVVLWYSIELPTLGATRKEKVIQAEA